MTIIKPIPTHRQPIRQPTRPSKDDSRMSLTCRVVCLSVVFALSFLTLLAGLILRHLEIDIGIIIIIASGSMIAFWVFLVFVCICLYREPNEVHPKDINNV